MADIDELTAYKPYGLLKGHYPQLDINVSTVKGVHIHLGVHLGWSAKRQGMVLWVWKGIKRSGVKSV